MLDALFNYQFLQNALLASVFASIVCGIIGVIIVEKKLVMMTGGIAHTAYGGVGLGYFLGFEPIIGAFLFSVLTALTVGFIKRKGSSRADVLIGLFWPLGMALGILFVSLMPGYPPDMSSYLFGSILTVTKVDLNLISIFTVIVVLAIFSLYNNWKSYLFDDQFSTIIGIKTGFLEYFILILIAMTVVVLIRVVGIILVLSLITAPATIAALFTNNFKNRMMLSIAFGLIFCVIGLVASYTLNISSGAAIVIVSFISYVILSLLKSFLLKRQG